MTDVKRLVYSIIQFLGDQIQSGTLSADAVESLEGMLKETNTDNFHF